MVIDLYYVAYHGGYRLATGSLVTLTKNIDLYNIKLITLFYIIYTIREINETF